MREQNQLNNVLKILDSYQSVRKEQEYLPLHQFQKNYFRANKQMGSNDRRTASRLLYNYFRMGNILKELTITERIAIGSFVCEQEKFPLLEFILKKHSTVHSKDLTLALDQKLEHVKRQYPSFNLEDIFSFKNHFSNGIDKEKFYLSFFIQPKLWIRIPKNIGTQHIVSRLEKENISFESYPEYPYTISFDNRTSLDKWKDKGYFEIQDLSSQLVGNYFEPKNPSPSLPKGEREYWWDCCAGSGGKSLLLLEKNPTIKIFATDNRESILRNLEFRMKNAEFKNISTKQIDLTSNLQFAISNLQFDGIIADVPCSGSGTWARTPEMLSRFSVSEIEEFHQQQKEIVQAVIPHLKKDGQLVYITCSVFKRENEEVVNYLVKECGMQLEKMELLKGYNKGADTLFVARLLKN